jgi:hypothetical protein
MQNNGEKRIGRKHRLIPKNPCGLFSRHFMDQPACCQLENQRKSLKVEARDRRNKKARWVPQEGGNLATGKPASRRSGGNVHRLVAALSYPHGAMLESFDAIKPSHLDG